MIDIAKGIVASLTLIALVAVLANTCAQTPRANCFTCVERCAPFRVAACEPAWSHVSPLYCACDPFTRLDEPPTTIGPAKVR